MSAKGWLRCASCWPRQGEEARVSTMAKRVETQYCESCQRLHVLEERYVCDACGGVICRIKTRDVNWFGRGVFTRVEEFLPTSKGETRQPITVTYTPALAAGQSFEFHFCCLRHAMHFLSDPPQACMDQDQVTMSATNAAYAQTPVADLPNAQQ